MPVSVPRCLIWMVALAGLGGCVALEDAIQARQQGHASIALASIADETEALAEAPADTQERTVADARNRAERTSANRDRVRLALFLLEPDTPAFDPAGAAVLLADCADGPENVPLCRVLYRLATHLDHCAHHDTRRTELESRLRDCNDELSGERSALSAAADEARARTELLVNALRQQTEAAVELRRQLEAIRNIESTLEQRQNIPNEINPDQLVEPEDDEEQADPSD